LAMLAAATPVAPRRIMSRRERFCALSDIAVLLFLLLNKHGKRSGFGNEFISLQRKRQRSRTESPAKKGKLPEWHKKA
jgi:hypothetical protein